jgi:hypothetical protein
MTEKTEVYRTPECRSGERNPEFQPEFQFGHQACSWPGYQHPALGWMVVQCGCACHTVSTVADE